MSIVMPEALAARATRLTEARTKLTTTRADRAAAVASQGNFQERRASKYDMAEA